MAVNNGGQAVAAELLIIIMVTLTSGHDFVSSERKHNARDQLTDLNKEFTLIKILCVIP